MSDAPLTFLATIPLTDGALKAHGDGGFRITLDLPDSEAPAYVRLLLCRQQILCVSVAIAGERPKREPTRKRKAKRETIPEWGDDGTDTDDNTG